MTARKLHGWIDGSREKKQITVSLSVHEQNWAKPIQDEPKEHTREKNEHVQRYSDRRVYKENIRHIGNRITQVHLTKSASYSDKPEFLSKTSSKWNCLAKTEKLQYIS